MTQPNQYEDKELDELRRQFIEKFPVILEDENGNETEVPLGQIIETQDILDYFDKYYAIKEKRNGV